MRVCTRALSCVQDDARACWRGPKQGGHQRRRLVGPCACVVCVCACRASSRGAAAVPKRGGGRGRAKMRGAGCRRRCLLHRRGPQQSGLSPPRRRHLRSMRGTGCDAACAPPLLLTWLSTPVTRRSSVAMPRLPPRLPPRLLLRPVASSPSRSPSPFSSPPPLDSARRPPTGDALAAPPIPVAPATFIKTISSPAPPSVSSPPPS